MDISQLKNLDVNQLLKRKDIVINLLILLIAFFVVRNVYQSSQTTEAALKIEFKKQQEVNRLLLDLNKWEEEVTNLQKDIPLGAISTVKIVDRVTNLAKESNISISSINPKSQADKGLYWEYPFEINLEADYFRTAGFLNDIENSQDFIRVDSLSVSTGAGSQGRAFQEQRNILQETKLPKVKINLCAISWKK